MTTDTPPALNALWAKLSKTDPANTKGFKRAGGFSGTAIKPMWVWQRLTEEFGPFGVGWGCDEPQFQVIPAGNEVLVYCTVRAWHGRPDASLWGVGGDKVVAVYTSGPKTDDEAFKKAYTDALMNAFKFIGVGADVHMGRFDDTKYVEQMEKEFSPPPEPQQRQAPPPLQGPIKTRAALKTACAAVVSDLHGCADADMLNDALREHKAVIDQTEAEHEFFWKGDGQDFNGLEREIELARVRVAADSDDGWKTNPLRAG